MLLNSPLSFLTSRLNLHLGALRSAGARAHNTNLDYGVDRNVIGPQRPREVMRFEELKKWKLV